MRDEVTTKASANPAAAPARDPQPTDVLLVTMPFGPHINYPSIAISLLKASLPPETSAKALYLTLPFAKRIGDLLYREISDSEPTTTGFAGEWLFCQELFPEEDHDIEAYTEDVLRGKSPGFGSSRRVEKVLNEKAIEKIMGARPKVSNFMDECVETVMKHRPRIVGFTSTFQQHAAGLALARRLKLEDESIFTVMGGANCEGIMGWETLRQFPFLDAVVSGESEEVFPKLTGQVLNGGLNGDLQGVFTRKSVSSPGLQTVQSVSNLTTPPIRDMDALPYPDFSDFFQQSEEQALEFADLDERARRPRLMFETSRGCWWGDKSHCTFCGLNGGSMAFRAKSAERAFEELTFLLDKYPGSMVSVVDNILSMKYFKDFLPKLKESALGTELFYEIKANISKKQLQMMRDAGIIHVQPGIESLNSEVLELMKKGITGIQNVQFLKFSKETGVRAYWNMLWGFPGETAENYKQVQETMSLIPHLPPPGGHGLIRLDRFSPNFNQADQLGFDDVRPYPAFDYIYKPLSPEARFNMSYFFTFRFRDDRQVEEYIAPVREKIHEWREAFDESDLFSVDKGDKLLIWDLRPTAPQHLIILDGVAKRIFEACDGICGLSKLQKLLETDTGKKVRSDNVERALAPLLEAGLMMREGQSVLNLALSLGDYSPPRKVLEKFQRIVHALGTTEGNTVTINLNQAVKKEVVA